MSSVEEIIGRTDPNDFDAILGMTNTDVEETIHYVEDNADCIYTWDYEKGARPQLEKLTKKQKKVNGMAKPILLGTLMSIKKS